MDYIKKTLDSKKGSIIIVFLFFLLYFLLYYYKSTISMDEIWNYGFSYNIAHGLIPYLDFNMIQVPLYSYLLGTFIFVFGNHFIFLILLNSLLSGLLQLVLIKKYGWKTVFLFPCIAIANFFCYNFLTLLLFVILLYIENDSKKENEYLKGFIISLLVFSKQTVGGVLLIISFLLSKNKKKYLIGFLPLCIVYLCYLLLSKSLFSFFYYCLLSLIDFTSGNSFSGISYTIIFYIILLMHLVMVNVKNKFKDRELLYILAYQVMVMPIFDYVHILVSSIPFIAYLLIKKHKKDLQGFLSLVVITTFIVINIVLVIDSFNTKSYVFYNSDSFLYGKRVNVNLEIPHIINNTLEKDYPGYKKYHLYEYAVLLKLENNQTIAKYDLNLKGNLGYHGEDKCIEEIRDNCSKQKCLIIIDSDSNSGTQISHKINDYVRNNYQFDKEMYELDFYTN